MGTGVGDDHRQVAMLPAHPGIKSGLGQPLPRAVRVVVIMWDVRIVAPARRRIGGIDRRRQSVLNLVNDELAVVRAAEAGGEEIISEGTLRGRMPLTRDPWNWACPPRSLPQVKAGRRAFPWWR